MAKTITGIQEQESLRLELALDDETSVSTSRARVDQIREKFIRDAMAHQFSRKQAEFLFLNFVVANIPLKD